MKFAMSVIVIEKGSDYTETADEQILFSSLNIFDSKEELCKWVKAEATFIEGDEEDEDEDEENNIKTFARLEKLDENSITEIRNCVTYILAQHHYEGDDYYVDVMIKPIV